MLNILTNIQKYYKAFERPISSVALVGGFVFNALFLKRIDLFWENFWVIIHILIIAICIVWINKQENTEKIADRNLDLHFWLRTVMQFMFGGLLSTFLVFYFRSTAISVTWPFLVLLASAFIINESLKKKYERQVFQIAFFYLIILTFSIYLIPLIFHKIGAYIFLLSVLSSLAFIIIFIYILGRVSREKFKQNKKYISISILSIFVVFNLLYFTNLIPPIPLSLKDGGIYHSVFRNPAGEYIVYREKSTFFQRFFLANNLHIKNGDRVFAYTAIFSPDKFYSDIYHEWQYYDIDLKKWTTKSTIKLSAEGGRENGFRTFSTKTFLQNGKWRVNVKTENGQIISRLRFNLTIGGQAPELIMENKD